MGLFDIFKKKSAEDQAELSIEPDMDDPALYDDDSPGDADVDKMNEHERVLHVVYELECEVNNGGFSQYFWNSSGDLANEAVDAFIAIGAPKTAEICRKAISVFGREIPTDRTERQEMLEELENEETDRVWEECDYAFYEYEEDLEALQQEYMTKYRSYFD